MATQQQTMPVAPPAAPVFHTPQQTSHGRKQQMVNADVLDSNAITTSSGFLGGNTDGLTTDRPKQFLPLRPGQPRRASLSSAGGSKTKNTHSSTRRASAMTPVADMKKCRERAYGRPDAWLSPSGRVHSRVNVKYLRELDPAELQKMEEDERLAYEQEQHQRRKEMRAAMQLASLDDDDHDNSADAGNGSSAAAEQPDSKPNDEVEADQATEPSTNPVYVDEKWLHTDNVAMRDWNIRREQPPDASDLLVVQQVDNLSKIKSSGTQEPDWLDENEPGLATMERARRRVTNNLMQKKWEAALKAEEEALKNPPPELPDDEADKTDRQEEDDEVEIRTPVKSPRRKGPNEVDFYGSLNAIPFLKKSPTPASPVPTTSKKSGNSSRSAKLKKKMAAKKNRPKAAADQMNTSNSSINSSSINSSSNSSRNPKPYPVITQPRALNEQEQLWKSMSALDNSQSMLDRPHDFLPLTPGDRKKEKKSPMMKAKERAYGRPEEWISPKKSPSRPNYRVKRDSTGGVPQIPGLDDSDRLADDDVLNLSPTPSTEDGPVEQ